MRAACAEAATLSSLSLPSALSTVPMMLITLSPSMGVSTRRRDTSPTPSNVLISLSTNSFITSAVGA